MLYLLPRSLPSICTSRYLTLVACISNPTIPRKTAIVSFISVKLGKRFNLKFKYFMMWARQIRKFFIHRSYYLYLLYVLEKIEFIVFITLYFLRLVQRAAWWLILYLNLQYYLKFWKMKDIMYSMKNNRGNLAASVIHTSPTC